MSWDTIITLFSISYPTGSIYSVPSHPHAYMVRFDSHGREYRYSAPSNIALARRLGLDVSTFERDYSKSRSSDDTVTIDEFSALCAEIANR